MKYLAINVQNFLKVVKSFFGLLSGAKQTDNYTEEIMGSDEDSGDVQEATKKRELLYHIIHLDECREGQGANDGVSA